MFVGRVKAVTECVADIIALEVYFAPGNGLQTAAGRDRDENCKVRSCERTTDNVSGQSGDHSGISVCALFIVFWGFLLLQ